MKNAIRILLLIVVLALLCVPFIPDTMTSMQKKAEKEGYKTFTSGKTLTVINSDTKATLNFFFFDSKEDAKRYYEDLQEIGVEDGETFVKHEGKMVYVGSEPSCDHLTRPAFLDVIKTPLKISGTSFLVYAVLLIAAVGYLLGRVTVKGVNLGTAGVFLVALLLLNFKMDYSIIKMELSLGATFVAIAVIMRIVTIIMIDRIKK